MKKIFKYASIALAAVMAMSVASCSEESHEYEPATPESGDQVYFSTETKTNINASASENTVSIPIYRIKSDAATSVPITITDEKGYFTAPSTVNFAAGQTQSTVDLSYVFDNIGYDNYSTVVLQIADPSYTTVYGISTLTVNIGIPAPWTSLGTCKFTEGWWSGQTYEKELQQNDNDPQTYRIVAPFDDAANYVKGAANFEFRIYKAGETLLGEVLTQDVVYYEDQAMTYYDYYDAVIEICHPGGFTAYATQEFWTYNKVVYQDNGAIAYVQIAPLYYMAGKGGWNQSQKNDIITINFPGYEPKDYTAEVAYSGMLSNNDGNFAVADATLGPDVASAKIAVIPDGEALNTIEEDILSGAVPSVEITESGSVYVPFSYEESGNYDLVIVAYDADGAEVNATYSTFKYVAGGGETWNKIGSGKFTYMNLFEGDDTVELYASSMLDTRYMIKNLFVEGTNFTFNLSKSGQVLVVDDQDTGYYYEGYGEVYVDDCADFYGSENTYGSSYYNDSIKTYFFATKYYIPNVGSFGVSGFETLELDAQAAEAVKARQARSRGELKLNEASKTITSAMRHDQKLDRSIQRR